MVLISKLKQHISELCQQWREGGFFAAVYYGWNIFRLLCLKIRVSYFDPSASARYPGMVDIEVTTVCNLRCPSCPHSQIHNTGAGAQHIEPATLESILNRLSFKPQCVVLGGVGEPLANPNLAALLDILAAKNIKCNLFTNGTLLNHSSCDMLLAHANLAYVWISVDGATEKTFEELRLGANFAKWKLAVMEFNNAVSQRVGSTLLTGTHTVISKRNADEIVDIVYFAAELGFKQMHFIDMISGGEQSQKEILPLEDLYCLLDKLRTAGRRLSMNVTVSHRRQIHPPKARVCCIRPWNYILIKANGDIEGCCALFERGTKLVMGNILKQDFNSIWRGEPFLKFRVANAKGTQAMCNLCPYY